MSKVVTTEYLDEIIDEVLEYFTDKTQEIYVVSYKKGSSAHIELYNDYRAFIQHANYNMKFDPKLYNIQLDRGLIGYYKINEFHMIIHTNKWDKLDDYLISNYISDLETRGYYIYLDM